jgi:very-short-patch-repair endonuclease
VSAGGRKAPSEPGIKRQISPVANAALASNEGFKFGRQVPIGRYIGDFACHEARLIVEIGSAKPVGD